MQSVMGQHCCHIRTNRNVTRNVTPHQPSETNSHFLAEISQISQDKSAVLTYCRLTRNRATPSHTPLPHNTPPRTEPATTPMKLGSPKTRRSNSLESLAGVERSRRGGGLFPQTKPLKSLCNVTRDVTIAGYRGSAARGWAASTRVTVQKHGCTPTPGGSFPEKSSGGWVSEELWSFARSSFGLASLGVARRQARARWLGAAGRARSIDRLTS